MNDKSLEWTAIPRGGWGDMFVSYANMCQLNCKFNVIHSGQDKYISKFLEYQDNVEKIIHIPYIPKKNIKENALEADEINRCGNKEWIKKIIDVDTANFVLTHADFDQKKNLKIIRKFKYKLPESKFKVKPHTLLFNPYSIQSLTLDNHCPLLPEIFAWLVNTGWNILLIGQKTYDHLYFGEKPFPLKIHGDADNWENLVGKTESMIDVFNIAKQCDGIITTSNCLSMWSIISNKSALVVLNNVLSNPKDHVPLNFYKMWITHEPNTLINYDCTPNQFMETFKKWEKTLKK